MKSKFTSKFLVLMALFVLIFSSAFAGGDIDESEIASKLNSLAGTSNVGREYIFSIPPPYDAESGGFDNFIRVFVISPVVTNIKVGIGGAYKTFKSKGNGLTVVDIPAASAAPFPFIATSQQPAARIYKDKAIHILAEEPVVVYVIVRYKYTTDGFLAIPVSSLGREYAVATSPQWGGGFNYKLTPWVNITAAFDKTKVTFTMGGGAVQSFTEIDGGSLLGTGQSRNWNMNKGETLIFAASSKDSRGNVTNGDGQDLTGSRIISNRPVALVTGHACNNIPIANTYCDYTCEMELPVVSWGKNVIIPQIAVRKKPGIIRIFAKENDTEIFRNGVSFVNVTSTVGAQGESFQEQRLWPIEQAPAPAVLTSTKPFYVMYYNPGTTEDNSSNSDPFVMVMTPVEQYQNDIIFCTPNAAGGDPFSQNWLNVVVEADVNGLIPNDFEFGTFTSDWQWQKVRIMNGATIASLPPFKMNVDATNPDRKFLIKNISLPYSGVFRLRCPSKVFASYSYGYGSYESYGYPTSAALADLSNIDVWKPIPTYKMECDGENGMTIKSGSVMDPIINGDPATQSKLSDAYMKEDSSYNYEFKLLSEIIPGETEQTSWSLTKINPREDSRADLVFIDRAGNDTTITILDIATKLDLAKDENFGNFKLNDPAVSKTFSVTNNSKKIVLVEKLELWKKTEGFKIEPLGFTLPTNFQIGETKIFNVTFTPDNNLPVGKKLLIDSIGVGDSCLYANLVEVRASLGAPNILADDHNFGIFNIDSPTPFQKQVRVQNPSVEADLTITGASALTNPAFTAVFNLANGTITKTQDITPANPITIKAGSYIQYDVFFKPTTTGTFSDQILFTADATLPDNVSKFDGIGSQALLAVNGLDWGEYRINRPGTFNIAPKIGVDNLGKAVITLENNGTDEVVVDDILLNSKSGNANSFLLDDQVTPLTNIKTKYPNIRVAAGGKFVAQIYFSPTVTGTHEVELTFVNNANIADVKSTLKGTGIVPRMVITQVIPFGSTIVGNTANPNPGLLSITNPDKSATAWEFGDTLTLGAFNANPAIADNLTSFGTEGFRYANSGIDSKGTPIPNLNGYKLAPGEAVFVNAEFVAQKAGPANATLVLNSDAEVSANPSVFNNRSVWTGDGLVQGVNLTTQSTAICAGTVAVLNFELFNTGTTLITISNFASNYNTNLTLNDAAMNSAFTVAAGSSRSFTMTFSPTAALAQRTVTLSYNTDILGDVNPRTASFDITAYDYTRTSSSNVLRVNADKSFGVPILPSEGVSIGEQFGYKITLDAGANFDNAKVGNLEVSFTYPTEFIKPLYNKNPAEVNNINVNSLLLGGALAGKYAIDYASITEIPAGNETKVMFTIKAIGTNILSGAGDIATVRFNTFLPTYTDSTKDAKLPEKYTATIKHTLSDLGNSCFEFLTPALTTVTLNDICASPIRAIVLSGKNYQLQQINPNPVGAAGGNINFSVGIEGQTELVIYNSNKEVIATVASGLMKEGNYTVALPMEKLASGAYFYELKSGFYTDVKKLIIAK